MGEGTASDCDASAKASAHSIRELLPYHTANVPVYTHTSSRAKSQHFDMQNCTVMTPLTSNGEHISKLARATVKQTLQKLLNHVPGCTVTTCRSKLATQKQQSNTQSYRPLFCSAQHNTTTLYNRQDFSVKVSPNNTKALPDRPGVTGTAVKKKWHSTYSAHHMMDLCPLNERR